MAKKSSSKHFQPFFLPFIIIRQDENNSTSIIRNRNRKHRKGRERKNYSKNQEKNRQENTQIFADFRVFSARGGVEQRQKNMRCLFQLLTQTRPTTTNGYEYTHLWNKHVNPVPWPCDNNVVIARDEVHSRALFSVCLPCFCEVVVGVSESDERDQSTPSQTAPQQA